MNIILLSGGSGKRLWPLSNDVRSKQFIKLFKNNDEYESMVQRVYRQITTVDADAKITIATSKSQASAIKNQLGEKASICVEPCRRDTFPAIALAAAYLHDELGVDELVDLGVHENPFSLVGAMPPGATGRWAWGPHPRSRRGTPTLLGEPQDRIPRKPLIFVANLCK